MAISSPSMSGTGPVITTSSSSVWAKPRDLFEAISRIQSFHAAQVHGSPMPPDFFMFNEKFGFWEVGMRSVLWDTLVVFFMVPLSVGAIDKLIPIFGSTEPTFFDQVFALLLAGAFTLGINLLIAINLGRCYFGEVPKMAIRHLYGGIVTANVLKVLVLFLAYHLAFDFLTEERIVAFYELLWRVGRGVLGEDLILALAEWTFDLRIVLWKSAYAVIAITVVSLLIPFVVFLIGKYRVQREVALQQKYGLS